MIKSPIRLIKLRDLSFIIFLGIFTILSCKKNEYIGKDPYANAKEPLAIKLNTSEASPAAGAPGTVVTLTGEGFAKYKDSGMVAKFNEVEGQIVEAGDNVLKVKVPEQASSGLITITIKDQVFPGPDFVVNGPIYIDSLFPSLPGAASGSINCIQFVPGGKYIIGGSFTDYGNSGLQYGSKGLARMNADGSIDRTFLIGQGVTGSVSSIIVQPDGKYIIGGGIANYNDRFKTKITPVGNIITGYISNITRLNADGSLDSITVITKAGNKDTLPALNAYFDGAISKILQTPDSGKMIVIGSYRFFMTKDFTAATLDGRTDSLIIDSIRMEGITQLNEDGTLDSSFNYNHEKHASYSGTNGPIYDAFVQDDGKIIIAGNFTKYHDKPANRIARLNRDGSLDNTFDVGTGPDDRVYSVALLPTGKYLISGQFIHVNGKESRKVAVLDENGSLENSFSVGVGVGAGPDGIAYNAAILKDGKILVSGSFDFFSGIKRNGTVVLNMDGSVDKHYNSLGAMSGRPTQALNVPNENATLLVGNFTKYDLKPVNRIVLLKY